MKVTTIGLYCDDITFCHERCDWLSCPRNQKNIRDKTIPHSFFVEIPEDCPKKGKAVKRMPDMEKVIKGLEIHTKPNSRCVGCPYPNNGLCGDQLYHDALAILKEQERKKGSWDYGTKCSVCKGTIIPPKDRKVRANFCPWCGADMRDSYEQEGR